MDLIAHWLKNEPSLQKELHEAMLAMGQQLNETPEAEQWPLRQWQSWLEENSFDLQLLQQALQQLFANAGETEPYAAIHQELSQQPGDGPGIERLLGCAEHHSEALFPQLLEQLEAEAKETEALLQTSGGSSSSHHKGFQYMSNHRAGLSAGGATVGAVALGGLGIWAYRTHTAKTRLLRTIHDAKDRRYEDNNEFAEVQKALTKAEEALKSWMPGKIQTAANKLSELSNKGEDYEDERNDKDTDYQVTGRVRNTEELTILQDAGANEPNTNDLAYTRTRPASKLLVNRRVTSSSGLDDLAGRISKNEQPIDLRYSNTYDENIEKHINSHEFDSRLSGQAFERNSRMLNHNSRNPKNKTHLSMQEGNMAQYQAAIANIEKQEAEELEKRIEQEGSLLNEKYDNAIKQSAARAETSMKNEIRISENME